MREGGGHYGWENIAADAECLACRGTTIVSGWREINRSAMRLRMNHQGLDDIWLVLLNTNGCVGGWIREYIVG